MLPNIPANYPQWFCHFLCVIHLSFA